MTSSESLPHDDAQEPQIIDEQRNLSAAYAAAYTEFVDSGDAALWDSVVSDGLT